MYKQCMIRRRPRSYFDSDHVSSDSGFDMFFEGLCSTFQAKRSEMRRIRMRKPVLARLMSIDVKPVER